jgi:hypothetical protein
LSSSKYLPSHPITSLFRKKDQARGFHGGKKVKGRSRQIAVDSQGQIWAVQVHAAHLADTKEAAPWPDEVPLSSTCIHAGKNLFTSANASSMALLRCPGGWSSSAPSPGSTASAEAMILIAAFARNLRSFPFS